MTEPQGTAAPAIRLTDLRKSFGPVTAVDGIDLEIADGEFFSMLGPSGSGKTTVLRMIAGFELPTAGSVWLSGRDVTRLAPFERDVNTVFQDYALFPHMSVRDNIAYGLRMRGVPAAQREEQVTRALEMVKLEQLGARSPRQLSGGQQQRVALARALVNRPRVLLLDEPLGALDLKLRKEMQLELKHLQTDLGITFVYVTHDQEEALTMSDRIVLMRQGRIAQIGTPRELYDRPASRYVADFIGDTNLLAGTVVESAGGVATLRVGDVALRGLSDGALPAGREAWLTVRPEAIRLIDGHAASAAQNTVAGTVNDAVYAGSALRVHVTLPGGQRLVASVPSGTSAPAGAPVTLSWPVELARCVGD